LAIDLKVTGLYCLKGGDLYDSPSILSV